MPQGYGKRTARSNDYALRQDLGYVPARTSSGSTSSGGSTSGGGVVVVGGPSGPVITSSRVQVQIIATPTHLLTADDLYTYMVFTNAGGCIVTVPTDLTAAWSIDTQPVFAFEQSAAGKVEIVAAGGVVVNTLAIFTLRTYGQYAVMQMIEKAPNVYTLFGAQELV